MHVGTHLTLPWILRVEGCTTRHQGHGRSLGHCRDLAQESRQNNEAALPLKLTNIVIDKHHDVLIRNAVR